MPEDRSAHTDRRMPVAAALEVLAGLRSDQVVVTSMGAVREWLKLSQHPLDFHYVPSAMGQAPMIALGIALARPDREVWCLSGDGAALMNLGCLVTTAAAGAKNLSFVLLDNGVYEVTGGQRTAGAVAQADFAGFARAAGIQSVSEFEDLAEWRAGAKASLAMPGPRFISLLVEPVREGYELLAPGPIADRMDSFRAALTRG